MLVQLSPWEKCHTSIRLTSSKRSRKENGSNEHERDPKGGGTNNLPFAFSFVNPITKRMLWKMKARSLEFHDYVPLLSVTTDHHISVIGRSSGDSGRNRTSDEVSATTPNHRSYAAYRELSTLQYNSRPGSFGSFFPSDDSGLPRIPAIVDIKNELAYAVQHNNRVLCCWKLWEGTGPDDSKHAFKVHLASPAHSMSLLPLNQGMVYGTCDDGKLFVAMVAVDADVAASNDHYMKTKHRLIVEYLPDQHPSGTIHVGTCAAIKVADKCMGSGRKRKVLDEDRGSRVIFYQVFRDDSIVQIVRRATSISPSMMNFDLRVDGHVPYITTVLDLRSKHFGRHQHTLTRGELLVSDSSSNPKVALVYVVSSKDITTNPWSPEQGHGYVATFCASLSLSTCSFDSQPLRLCSEANQFSQVAENMLACGSKDSITIYNMRSGALVSKKSLASALLQSGCAWTVGCHPKKSTVVVLSVFQHQKDQLLLLATSLGDIETGVQPSSFKASAFLSTSLATSSGTRGKSNGVIPLAAGVGRAVSTALGKLGACKEQLLVDDVSSLSFSQLFDECAMNLKNNTSAVRERPMDRNDTSHNPQDSAIADPKNSKGPAKTLKMNSRHYELSQSLPQSFIDGAVQITLDAIHSSAKGNLRTLSKLGYDARLVLKRLLLTGRVPARLHFEGSYALLETTKRHPLHIVLSDMHCLAQDNPLPAVQLVVEMLKNCSDLSERQLVIMMDYMMKIPKADDIAQTFAESTPVQIRSMLRRDSKPFPLNDGKGAKSSQSGRMSEEVEIELEPKLILAGAELVLHMILCYSELNEAMLRTALSEGLNSPREVIVLAQLLSRMLRSSPSNAPSFHHKNANFVRTTCLWIASLCESFQDELHQTKSPSGADYLTYLQTAVQRAIQKSQAILSLKDGIGVAEAMRKERHVVDIRVRPVEGDIPGYSIDRFLLQ